MITDSILDEMDLPLANENEELETISKRLLQPLFDVSKFEVRSEDFRDKGIDLFFEIKKAGKYTNFRFAVQLKATDAKKINTDESISLQIHTSNINYLLNHGMPAFYILYYKPTNTFYYENLNEFIKSLSKTKPGWEKQPTHALRFNKVLTADAITNIHTYTIKKGLFNRKLSEKLIEQSAAVHSTDKILIDSNLHISGDAEIRDAIEKIGFTLINEGRWKEVIQVHKKGSGTIAATALYNLILGIASYYNGNLIEALAFLKAAANLRSELDQDLVDHLHYFTAGIKSALGLITEKEYKQAMEKLEDAKNVGLYIKLEKAKNNYFNFLEQGSSDPFEKMIADIKNIINHPKADNAIKFNARCELILLKGHKKNWEDVRTIAVINAIEVYAGPNPEMRADAINNFISANAAWFKEVAELKADAYETNHFYYCNALLNEVKVLYEMLVYKDSIFIEKQIPGQSPPAMPDRKPAFDDLLQKLELSLNFYRQVGHIDNQVVSLCARYEILHYLQNFVAAKEAIDEAEQLIENFELTERKQRLEHLKNAGTTHQQFKAWVDSIFEEQQRQAKELQQLTDDMKRMDGAESNSPQPTLGYYVIDLFPIGLFKFPKEAKEMVYQILNIKDPTVQNTFYNLNEKEITPIANIYYHEITREGPQNGRLADRGLESWKHIHSIRKAFYENKFYRMTKPKSQ